jgi:threonylcarbamoyladenosine tRNA methylthiotransferase MtaB
VLYDYFTLNVLYALKNLLARGAVTVRFCFETLGCKVNQFETQALETILQSRGHTPARAGEGCDAVIVNTCAVTAESGRKSRQAIRRLKKLEPEAISAVCGCFSQVSPEEINALEVDLVSGSGDRLKFVDELERAYADKAEKRANQLPSGSGDRPAYVHQPEQVTADKVSERNAGDADRNVASEARADKDTAERHGGCAARRGHDTARIHLDDALKRRVFEELPAGSAAGRTRAMLKIQDGCQNFCAYCIIPYARGPVRSLPLERVAAEAARLNAEGYGEIVVTGIEISSYGKDLNQGAPPRGGTSGDGTATDDSTADRARISASDKVSLIDAVMVVSGAAAGARVRLGSLEPRTVTEAFCRELKALPNICDHFHLSLQSGCDETLRRMKRRYATADFYEAVRLLRSYYPNCGITADLIVGFPGETEEEFEKTLAFIKKCAFSAMHIFPYSKRPGTPAADMPEQVPKAMKQERARKASEAAGEMARAYAKSCVGSVLEVLFEREEDGRWFGQSMSVGHAGNYLEVRAEGADLRNKRLPVRIKCEKDGLLFGEIINP